MALALVCVCVGACGSLQRRPVPVALADSAMIDGAPDARFWGDRSDPALLSRLSASLRREMAHRGVERADQLPPASYLALSGGGSDGAFGAGLLCGWTAHGTRPTFRVVTGVSTGALIAPFAFLGSDYDHVLREVYTTIATRDVERRRSWLGALLSESIADATPLRRLLERYVDDAFVERVAEESLKGRQLLLATTNLDAQRPVMWSMGALARSGHPQRSRLFREVMLASAAIPGVFPPVLFEVRTADGQVYDEMHADGGVSSQVFLYPASLSVHDLDVPGAADRKRHVYVIRNAKLGPEPKPIARGIVSISGRAIGTLIKTQGVGDLYRIYLGALRDGIDYNLAFIPDSFEHPAREEFDTVRMRALFELGFGMARDGMAWHKAPPGFEAGLHPPAGPATDVPALQPHAEPASR